MKERINKKFIKYECDSLIVIKRLQRVSVISVVFLFLVLLAAFVLKSMLFFSVFLILLLGVLFSILVNIRYVFMEIDAENDVLRLCRSEFGRRKVLVELTSLNSLEFWVAPIGSSKSNRRYSLYARKLGVMGTKELLEVGSKSLGKGLINHLKNYVKVIVV